jgi:hypothetical protein
MKTIIVKLSVAVIGTDLPPGHTSMRLYLHDSSGNPKDFTQLEQEAINTGLSRIYKKCFYKPSFIPRMGSLTVIYKDRKVKRDVYLNINMPLLPIDHCKELVSYKHAQYLAQRASQAEC